MTAILLLVAGIGIVNISARSAPSTSEVGTPAAPGRSGSASLAEVRRAVVNINTFAQSIDSPPGSGNLRPLGAGTGMILTSDGEILTNNHVIRQAASIRVSIPGRSQTYTASVVGAAPSADVALIKIDNVSGLPTVTMADPSTVNIGDRVTALGNALGRGGSPTVTKGVITGMDRSITARDPISSPERLSGLIQTDAKIVPGDSGGPLVDTSGHVVGMITAGSATQGGGSATVGFAIPTSTAIQLVNKMRAGEASSTILLGERGYLGVAVPPADSTQAIGIRQRLGSGRDTGAPVVGIQPQGPADQAGMTAPALITSIDGRSIGSADALGPAIHAHKPGDKIQVTWVDQSGTHTATVTLIPGPAV
ncbi:MAG TPA: trypsin-like peptidase domain-containing protein [Actinomycetota bacterium]|jgi:S1-C subfamily serine protease|nr:trypsin-like peptidase domain-containing protein [Actinomycetota bacterium]